MRSISFASYKQIKERSPCIEKEKALKAKIKKASKAIRKKYLALKLGKAEEDETINRLLKPVIVPLQEIKSASIAKKLDPSVEVKKTLDVKQLKKEEDSIFEDTFETIAVDEYPIITRSYIEELFNKSKDIDTTYGIRLDDTTNKLYIGNTEVQFESDDGIRIGEKMYKGRRGLYELLFMKNPQDYNEQDLDDYKEILETSSAHKRNYDSSKQLNGTRCPKYKEIIKPLSKRMKYTYGSGITNMIYNEKPVEYVYWDDVNELVDRLRLLNASKLAGNTDSHDNEILAIINELREARVIY